MTHPWDDPTDRRFALSPNTVLLRLLQSLRRKGNHSDPDDALIAGYRCRCGTYLESSDEACTDCCATTTPDWSEWVQALDPGNPCHVRWGGRWWSALFASAMGDAAWVDITPTSPLFTLLTPLALPTVRRVLVSWDFVEQPDPDREVVPFGPVITSTRTS